MNEAIASILKSKLVGISYADKVAGLVRPVTFEINQVAKTYPVGFDVKHDDCIKGLYNDLMPNSKYKSIMYFEDNGTQFLARIGDYQVCQSSLRLVGWINTSKFQETNCPTPESTCMIMEIISAFPSTHFNQGDFQKIQISVNNEVPKSKAIFAAYTYDELMSQYLFYPYDYFALNLTVNYTFNMNCLCTKELEE